MHEKIFTKNATFSRGFAQNLAIPVIKKMGNFILHEPKGKSPAIDKTIKRACVYVKNTKISFNNITVQAKLEFEKGQRAYFRVNYL